MNLQQVIWNHREVIKKVVINMWHMYTCMAHRGPKNDILILFKTKQYLFINLNISDVIFTSLNYQNVLAK